jgi:hypothetical protein
MTGKRVPLGQGRVVAVGGGATTSKRDWLLLGPFEPWRSSAEHEAEVKTLRARVAELEPPPRRKRGRPQKAEIAAARAGQLRRKGQLHTRVNLETGEIAPSRRVRK